MKAREEAAQRVLNEAKEKAVEAEAMAKSKAEEAKKRDASIVADREMDFAAAEAHVSTLGAGARADVD